MSRILLIEDDVFPAFHLRDKLATKFDVSLAASAEDGIVFLQSLLDISALIVDVMMPTPKNVPPTLTGNSLDTGLWILEEMAEFIISRKIPTLIYTNRLPDHVDHKLRALEYPHGQVEAAYKQKCLHVDIPFIMERMIVTSAGLPGLVSVKQLSGFDQKAANSLSTAGLDSLDKIRKCNGVGDLVARTKLTDTEMNELFNIVALMTIRGIGYKYAKLLLQSGISTIKDLAQGDAQVILQNVVDLNATLKLVYFPPNLVQINDWISQARQILK